MKSVPSLLFFRPMKKEPTVFPFGPIAEMIVVPKRPYRPGEKCLDKSTGEVVTILSCEPIRVEEVTEEDIIKAGLADGSCVWANGAARCDAKGDLVVNQFMTYWRHRHPGKEWAWRVEAKEEIIVTN